MEALGFLFIIITILIIGYVIWLVSSINEKLELLIRMQLKRDDIKFNDKDLQEDIEKYRDK